MDTEEFAFPLSVRVLDIEMPERYGFDSEAFAERYGIAGAVSECETEGSVRGERFRYARQDIQLLWLLEQEQIGATDRRSIDLDSLDPAARYRRICDGIKDVGTVREVRSEIITTLQEARIPQVDIGDTLCVKATVAPTTPADFAYGTG